MFNIKQKNLLGFLTAFTLLATATFADLYDQNKPNNAKSEERGYLYNQANDLDQNKSQKDTTNDSQQKSVPHVVKLEINEEGTLNASNSSESNIIEIAILGSSGFDVNNIDRKSLEIGNLVEGNAEFEVADSNKDGFDDLIAKFPAKELRLNAGDQEIKVSGETKDGRPFEGSAYIAASGLQ